MANTLAYYHTATITTVKSFIVQAPGISLKDITRYPGISQEHELMDFQIVKFVHVRLKTALNSLLVTKQMVYCIQIISQ